MKEADRLAESAPDTPLAIPRELTLPESILLGAIRLYEKYRTGPLNALRRFHNLPEHQDPLAGYDEAVRKARAMGESLHREEKEIRG